MSGRMRIGAQAGIRPGKWSVIMDFLCFAFLLMRRLLVRFALSFLHRRDARENYLTDSMYLVDRGGTAGAGRGASDVGGPSVSFV